MQMVESTLPSHTPCHHARTYRKMDPRASTEYPLPSPCVSQCRRLCSFDLNAWWSFTKDPIMPHQTLTLTLTLTDTHSLLSLPISLSHSLSPSHFPSCTSLELARGVAGMTIRLAQSRRVRSSSGSRLAKTLLDESVLCSQVLRVGVFKDSPLVSDARRHVRCLDGTRGADAA